MFIPQKIHYVLRALHELGKMYQPIQQTHIKVAHIAEKQAIPLRFLEILMNTLKKGGFIVSFRGKKGGYQLARPPRLITVGQIMDFMQGPTGVVECCQSEGAPNCPIIQGCAFKSMWQEVRDSVSQIYHRTTLQNLIDAEAAQNNKQVLNFSI